MPRRGRKVRGRYGRFGKRGERTCAFFGGDGKSAGDQGVGRRGGWDGGEVVPGADRVWLLCPLPPRGTAAWRGGSGWGAVTPVARSHVMLPPSLGCRRPWMPPTPDPSPPQAGGGDQRAPRCVMPALVAGMSGEATRAAPPDPMRPSSLVVLPPEPPSVMPALVAGIHDFPSDGGGQVVDARDKPGHDGRGHSVGNAPSGDPSPLVGEGARVSGRVRGEAQLSGQSPPGR